MSLTRSPLCRSFVTDKVERVGDFQGEVMLPMNDFIRKGYAAFVLQFEIRIQPVDLKKQSVTKRKSNIA